MNNVSSDSLCPVACAFGRLLKIDIIFGQLKMIQDQLSSYANDRQQQMLALGFPYF